MDRTFVFVDLSGDTSTATGVRWGSRSCVSLVVRQATDSLCLDRVVVVAPHTDDPRRESALREVVPPEVPIFTSSHPDALGRLNAAAHAYDATGVIRVDGTQMLVDPAFIDRLLAAAHEVNTADYIGYIDEAGRYLAESVALLPEWCHAMALDRADREAFRSIDRESATRYLRHHSKRFRLMTLPVAPRDLLAARRCVSYVNQDWEINPAVAIGSGDWPQGSDSMQMQSLGVRN
jgi:spore coat polysaccharide biosynthesis protein SpsF (cytidylyltransferase family)